MKAVVLERPGLVAVREEPAEDIAPGEALVGLRLGGICGSDVAAYRGTAPQASYPCVLGHELLVDVLNCPDAPALEGRRAVVEPLLSCGSCRACRLGRSNCCRRLRVLGVQVHGGLRERATMGAGLLHPVPDGVPDEAAVLAEPLSVAYHAVRRAEAQAGQVALVFGAGPIGLLVGQLLARARGCRVLAVDAVGERLRVAERLGATALPADPGLLPDAIAEETGGELADLVVDATGSPECLRMAIDAVAPAGTIVVIGWQPGAVEVDMVTLLRKEVDLRPSRTSVGAFPYVLRLLAGGLVDGDALVTHRYGLEGAGAALELLSGGSDGALKVLIGGTADSRPGGR